MAQIDITDVNSEDILPPEEQLTAPSILSTEETSNLAVKQTNQGEPAPVKHWLVVAKNRRVNRDWELLLSRTPENARRCYEDLCTVPMARKQGRVFPLKGKRYQGAWEYEVTKGDRVFYVPDAKRRKVIVYYAGEHPKNAPMP